MATTKMKVQKLSRGPRRRYRTPSKSTRFAVYVYYGGGLDGFFDQALQKFARLYGLGFGGSGMWLTGKPGGQRDISFCCGDRCRAKEFLTHVRERFKVRAKLVDSGRD